MQETSIPSPPDGPLPLPPIRAPLSPSLPSQRPPSPPLVGVGHCRLATRSCAQWGTADWSRGAVPWAGARPGHAGTVAWRRDSGPPHVNLAAASSSHGFGSSGPFLTWIWQWRGPSSSTSRHIHEQRPLTMDGLGGP